MKRAKTPFDLGVKKARKDSDINRTFPDYIIKVVMLANIPQIAIYRAY